MINNQNKADLFTSAKGNTTMVAASNDGKTKGATRPEDVIVDNADNNDANDDDEETDREDDDNGDGRDVKP